MRAVTFCVYGDIISAAVTPIGVIFCMVMSRTCLQDSFSKSSDSGLKNSAGIHGSWHSGHRKCRYPGRILQSWKNSAVIQVFGIPGLEPPVPSITFDVVASISPGHEKHTHNQFDVNIAYSDTKTFGLFSSVLSLVVPLFPPSLPPIAP